MRLVSLLALTLAAPAFAGPPKSFRVTSYKDLSEGQQQGVMLSSQGEALAGLAATRLGLPSLSDDSVRALLQAPDGAVYAGTGGDGPSILLYEKGRLRKLLRLEAQTWVSALCLAPQGARGGGELLAATAQDGRIFQVSRDGRSRVLTKLEGDHVWALLPDPRRDRVFAATGPGRVYGLTFSGQSVKVEKLFDSGARQVLAMALSEDGQLALGTADDAVLYRLDPDKAGSARALHDFAGNELRALGFHKGVLYAAVNDMQRGEGAGRSGVRLVPPAAGTPGAGKSGSTDKGKGALFRIDEGGRVEQLHSVSDGFFNALQVDGAGNVWAAASTPGGRGRLYWVRPDRTVLTALELKESDVLSLSLGRERLLGTGNSGALYRLEEAPPKDASYTSKVLDGGSLSQWGSLRYSATGGVRLETRSGNLAKPDGTWGPWQALGRPDRPGPTGEAAGKVQSPRGRYLQVRALFGDKAAVLQDFTVTYQPLNQRARVTEVQVGEDPLGRLARGPRAGDRKPRQPVVKIRWKVENPDEDELVYRLYVRPAARPGARGDGGPGEGWLRLGGPDPLPKAEYEWNTETVADGPYEVRVVASDEKQNPAEQALSAELTSPPFLVDNRRPEIRDVSYSPQTGVVSGRAFDATSPLGELSFAVDGGDFLPVGARDGVLDDATEEFAFKLPRLGPGGHTVLIRAADAADNAAVVQLVVQGGDLSSEKTPPAKRRP